jgi:PAS domain S-box-containing protein
MLIDSFRKGSDHMSIFTISAFLISLLYLYLGLKTLRYDYKNKLHIVFSLICLSMVQWSFFAGLWYSQKTDEHLLLLIELAYIGAFFYFPLNLHFYLILNRTKTNIPLLAFMYAPAVIFNIAHATGQSFVTEFIKYKGEWLAIVDPDSVFIYCYCLYIVTCISMAAVNIFRWGRHTTVNKEKKYSIYLFISLVFANAASFITTLVLPINNIYDYEAIGVILFYLYVIGLFYVIMKLRFLNLNHSLMGDEIISNINDIVILLDADMNIMDVNNRFNELLTTSPEKIKMKSFFDIISSNDVIKDKIASIKGSRIERCDLKLNFKKDDEFIITKSHISRMKDRFGDFTGFLVISTEVKEIKQFQKYFKISNREMEVIELIIFGLTYRDVSEKLNITEKTVETHLTNIYNKLGINNKIELVRIAGDFNITPAQYN